MMITMTTPRMKSAVNLKKLSRWSRLSRLNQLRSSPLRRPIANMIYECDTYVSIGHEWQVMTLRTSFKLPNPFISMPALPLVSADHTSAVYWDAAIHVLQKVTWQIWSSIIPSHKVFTCGARDDISCHSLIICLHLWEVAKFLRNTYTKYSREIAHRWRFPSLQGQRYRRMSSIQKHLLTSDLSSSLLSKPSIKWCAAC